MCALVLANVFLLHVCNVLCVFCACWCWLLCLFDCVVVFVCVTPMVFACVFGVGCLDFKLFSYNCVPLVMLLLAAAF